MTRWELSEAALKRVTAYVVAEDDVNDCTIGDRIREALRAEHYHDCDQWRDVLLYWRENGRLHLLCSVALHENRETRTIREATRNARRAAMALQYEQHRCQPDHIPDPYKSEES